MYYPLLRARQFELIALRELAIEGSTQDYIVPILEPVKESPNSMDLAFKVFQERRQLVYLILNPLVGDKEGDTDYYLTYFTGLEKSNVLPAFYYRNNGKYIRNSIRTYNLDKCMLICKNDAEPNDSDFKGLMGVTEINAVNVEGPGRNRALDRFLKSQNKSYIRLDDLFEKQARNSDYLDIEEHRFSEEHLYYKEDRYSGFSDYTVLPSEYTDGGSTPRAVVIHLTYLNDQAQILIRHFTSDNNDSIANVQGKFAEAANKAVLFCRSHGLTNSAIVELEAYFDESHYPGLGTVKKISIKNHLLVVGQYLRTR